MITVNLIGIALFVAKAIVTITIVSAVMAAGGEIVHEMTDNKIAQNIYNISVSILYAMVVLMLLYIVVMILYWIWTD